MDVKIYGRLLLSVVGILALSGVAGIPRNSMITQTGVPSAVNGLGVCSAQLGPEYYAFDLVTTNRVPGSGLAVGRADISVSPTSPFAVALAADGSYQYNVDVSVQRMKQPRDGVLVAWVTTREVDEVKRIGTLDEDFRATGTTSWNKFLVVITWEPTDDASAQRWSGPVALRGMSRSGMMHTMAGHGAFQQENCAAYGYDD